MAGDRRRVAPMGKLQELCSRSIPLHDRRSPKRANRSRALRESRFTGFWQGLAHVEDADHEHGDGARRFLQRSRDEARELRGLAACLLAVLSDALSIFLSKSHHRYSRKQYVEIHDTLFNTSVINPAIHEENI